MSYDYDRRASDESGAAKFIEDLTKKLDLKGRQVKFRTTPENAPGSRRGGMVFVNFYNLPTGVGSAGGGAEAENNRMLFVVEGFGLPTGKVKVEMSTSALPREHKLRAKTDSPERVAQYLAAFINKVVKEVPPHFTHTKV